MQVTQTCLVGALQYLSQEADSTLAIKLRDGMGIPSLMESSRGEDEIFVSQGGFSRQLLHACAGVGQAAVVLLSLCYEVSYSLCHHLTVKMSYRGLTTVPLSG